MRKRHKYQYYEEMYYERLLNCRPSGESFFKMWLFYACFHYELNGREYLNYLGRLVPRYKIRTKRKVIYTIIDKMKECIEEGTAYGGKRYISQPACYADTGFVADLIEERFPNLDGKVVINNVGTTIGTHVPRYSCRVLLGKRKG